jgi:hypothetical protein
MPSLGAQTEDLFTEQPLVKLAQSDNFVGWCYKMSYDTAHVMVNDLWKAEARGVPHNCFLTAASFDPEDFGRATKDEQEVILLRVTGTSKLPQDDDLIAAKIDYFQQHREAVDADRDYDDITRNKMQFHGLECRILGTFYKQGNKLWMGSDIESFSSATRLNVYRPRGEALQIIVNYVDPLRRQAAQEEAEEMGIDDPVDPFKVGSVRYTSTDRLHRGDGEPEVSVQIQPSDFLARRTAVLGMTRTGKSNMIKQLVSVVKRVSDDSGVSIGQIIYDLNGEYANTNQQDEGSIADVYPQDEVVRYSMRPPSGAGFKELRTNFYEQLNEGHSIIRRELERGNQLNSDYKKAFANMSFDEPQEWNKKSRWKRWVAAYKATLSRAGFTPPSGHKVYFDANGDVRDAVNAELEGDSVDPSDGLTPDEAADWFVALQDANAEETLKSGSGKDWVDDTLQVLLDFVAMNHKGSGFRTGHRLLTGITKFHSPNRSGNVAEEIYEYLEEGRIVILDLSLAQPSLREEISKDVASTIFNSSMEHFVEGSRPPNIVVYTEESHNLIGRDLELDDTWPRLAKEGAKYNVAMVYATQEVSSVHPNILANTENWFITHLNNEREIKELSQFYDFADFSGSLLRAQDVGFARVKTLSGPFIIPTQIDKFDPDREKRRVEEAGAVTSDDGGPGFEGNGRADSEKVESPTSN